MSQSLIKIEWTSSIEYIGLDLSSPDSWSEITRTTEIWTEDTCSVNYVVFASVREKWFGKKFELHLEYKRSKNRKLNSEGYPMGASRICISKGASEGKAFWREAGAERRGFSNRWSLVPCVSQRARVQSLVSRLSRQQQQFRNLLLMKDSCCAISGENTGDCLDAAHLIPVKDGSLDSIENGILLRSDLHRLFDAGKFSFGIDGQVLNVAEDLSIYYKKLLKGARLSNSVVSRVKNSLLFISFFPSNRGA
jgi:HNH endonuclease